MQIPPFYEHSYAVILIIVTYNYIETESEPSKSHPTDAEKEKLEAQLNQLTFDHENAQNSLALMCDVEAERDALVAKVRVALKFFLERGWGYCL